MHHLVSICMPHDTRTNIITYILLSIHIYIYIYIYICISSASIIARLLKPNLII